ncbi:C2H2-type zinc finger protein LALA0_S02e08350g [Lachancea lanzarotensis]|uniref:LALA0S02e08350g1_1 n=1 Tax=Lachancea lanzarotensis TaxID=1245769 RepID=A0A0C7N6X5_9SACH|nr:uncharacterized protein LALA0_S02e08350g [Lachancea lanzarotensis]CEP61173.1 LALA0S02e08350g1_1 [Lachancea lanzarotensis]
MATLYAIDQHPLQLRSLSLSLPSASSTTLHKCIALDNGPQGKQVLLPAPELNLAQLADWETDLKRQLDRWAFAPRSRAGSASAPEALSEPFAFGTEDKMYRTQTSRGGQVTPPLPLAVAAPRALVTPHGHRAKAHSVERRRKYVCKTCDKGFTTSGHLARHKRIHTGEKNHVCPHAGCGQRFSRHDNCVQHYKTHLRA